MKDINPHTTKESEEIEYPKAINKEPKNSDGQ